MPDSTIEAVIRGVREGALSLDDLAAAATVGRRTAHDALQQLAPERAAEIPRGLSRDGGANIVRNARIQKTVFDHLQDQIRAGVRHPSVRAASSAVAAQEPMLSAEGVRKIWAKRRR